jgi:NH3-dependent NAD+ synthetase
MEVLIPVSGGSDSALSFWLSAQRIKARTKGVYIGTDLRRKDWFDTLGTVYLDTMSPGKQNPEVARWAHFLSLCLEENRILIGSRNRTETYLGTFSNASRVAALLPLAGLWKHEVMELCAYVGVPEEIISSSLKADPECGRPESMADIPHEVVDRFLQEKLWLNVNDALTAPSETQSAYLEKIYTQNAYKVSLPIIGTSAE